MSELRVLLCDDNRMMREALALYLAAQGLKDDGWRYQSPARIARFYADLGRKSPDSELHLIVSAADNFFGVVGPTPTPTMTGTGSSLRRRG